MFEWFSGSFYDPWASGAECFNAVSVAEVQWEERKMIQWAGCLCVSVCVAEPWVGIEWKHQVIHRHRWVLGGQAGIKEKCETPGGW